jgi:glycosyltransferase involved in cell wall biosynthesis
MASAETQLEQPIEKLRVLLVPDSTHWVLGALAKAIAQHNDMIDAEVVSGSVLAALGPTAEAMVKRHDVVHFLCPYTSRRWLPILRSHVPCVTSHHHVSVWADQQHNLEGDAIIVGSTEWMDDVIERGAIARKVVRVPYGVDIEAFTPATSHQKAVIRRKLGITTETLLIGFFAKRSSDELNRKGIDVFVAAMLELHQHLPEAAALIVGPGWQDVVSSLRKRGVQCVWLPYIADPARLPQMYHALDFYWVTARVEGGPVPLLEAMSSGICCLSTRVGLARDIVRDGIDAVLLPFNDPGEVASHTRKLWSQPDARARMAESARATIVAKMDRRVTLQGVDLAYRIATREFTDRMGCVPRAYDVSPFADAALREQVEILEELTWAEALLLQKQSRQGYTIMLSAVVRRWRSSLPLRYLGRNILPNPLTSAILRARRILGRRTGARHDAEAHHR